MSESNQDNTLNYWMDWLNAHHIDYSKIPNKEIVNWVNDMEECVGEFVFDMIPDEWLDSDTLDEEWEELPDEDDDHED